MLKKEIAKIDWDNKTSQELKNLIRGLNPFMGGVYLFKRQKDKIMESREIRFKV